MTTAKMAGQLIAKNAEKARLLNITLPGLFHALGKRLFEAKSFQNELADIWSIIDELLRQLKSLRSPTVAQTTQQGIADRAKQAAIRAGDAAQAKLIEAKLSSAITKLGTIAYELYGQQAGEPELMQPIKDAQNKVAALDSDILSLGTSTKGGWLTPKRLIVGGVAAVCLIGVMLMSVGGPTHSTDESEQEKNVRWGESVRDSREIAEESDLEGLGFAKIIDLLGNPDEVFRSRRSPNVGLAIWQTGSNEYTVVGFIESIDGHSPTLVLSTAQKRSPSIVEKLKATVDGF